jgi:hypothetical protein
VGLPDADDQDPTDPNPATNDSGVDLFGNNPNVPDPDSGNAPLFHNTLMGSGPVANTCAPVLEMLNPKIFSNWTSGDFRSSYNRYYNTSYSMRWFGSGSLPMLAKITIGGGIAVWGLQNDINPFPLDSIRGSNTGENLSDPKVRAAVLAAVIPMPTNPPLTLPVSYNPGDEGAVGQVLLKVADPPGQ